MSTVKLVDENTNHPKVRAIFEDIKTTKKIDRVPNIWRALATHPEHLELCWTRLKAIMHPGKVDLLTKEIIALAVSVTTWKESPASGNDSSPSTSTGMEGSTSRTGWPRSSSMARTLPNTRPQMK